MILITDFKEIEISEAGITFDEFHISTEDCTEAVTNFATAVNKRIEELKQAYSNLEDYYDGNEN